MSAPELHADEPRDAEEPDEEGAGFVSGVRQPEEEGGGYEMDDFDGEENGPRPPLPTLVPKPPAQLPYGFSGPPGEHVAGYDRQALPLRSPLAELPVTSRRYDEADAAVDDALDRAVAEALGVPPVHAEPAKPPGRCGGRPQSAAVARSQHAPSSANTALLSVAEPPAYGAVFAAQGAAVHASAHHGAEHAQGEQLVMATHACAHHGAEQLVQAPPAPPGRDRRARPASAHPHGRVGKAQRGGGRLSNADRERAEAAAAYLAPLEEDAHPPYAPQPSHAPQPAARAVVSGSSARLGHGLTPTTAPAPPPPPPVHVPLSSSGTPDARLEQELRLLEHVYRPDVFGAPPAALQQAVAGRHRRDGERPPARAQSAGVARESGGRDGGASDGGASERVVAGGERDVVFTEFTEILPGPARRRRARSARTSSVSPAPVVDLRDEDGAGAGAGGMSGYLVGLRGAREEPSPYLAGMDSLLGGFPARFTTAMKGGVVQPVKIKDKRAQPGAGDMILYDQQLRILSSLYGTPIRGGLGVPPATDAAAIASGVAKFAKRQGGRVAVGSGVAVAKAARFASPTDL